MKDREFLIWIHERLEHVHNENPLVDYMHKLRAIICSIDPTIETGSCGFNSINELLKFINEK